MTEKRFRSPIEDVDADREKDVEEKHEKERRKPDCHHHLFLRKLDVLSKSLFTKNYIFVGFS